MSPSTSFTQPYRPDFLQRSQHASKESAGLSRWKACPADRLRPRAALVVGTLGGLATAFADGRDGADTTLERAAPERTADVLAADERDGADATVELGEPERAADVAVAAIVAPALAAIASAATIW